MSVENHRSSVAQISGKYWSLRIFTGLSKLKVISNLNIRAYHCFIFDHLKVPSIHEKSRKIHTKHNAQHLPTSYKTASVCFAFNSKYTHLRPQKEIEREFAFYHSITNPPSSVHNEQLPKYHAAAIIILLSDRKQIPRTHLYLC